MRRCTDIVVDLPAYLAGELDPPRRALLDEHLAGCARCSAELSDMRMVVDAVGRAGLDHAPPERLEREALTLVTLEPDPAGRDRADLSAASAATTAGLRRGAVALLAPALGAATLVLGVLGVGWRSDLSDVRERMRAMRQQLGPTGTPVQGLDFFAGEPSSASAHGELVRQPDGNYRLVVWSEGLPQTPSGYRYEVWMADDEGWVSAGSFRVEGDDSIVWSCPVGVPVAEVQEVRVTLEPNDGDPRRTGRSVFRAVL